MLMVDPVEYSYLTTKTISRTPEFVQLQQNTVVLISGGRYERLLKR